MGEQVAVEVLQSKPRSDTVRFLRYSAPVPCESCKRKSRHHWTMTVRFTVGEIGFLIRRGSTVHEPFAPVCRSHFLLPEKP